MAGELSERSAQETIGLDRRQIRVKEETMLTTLLKSKLLREEVTDRALHYEGSLAIDKELMDQVGLVPYEKILIANIANGERLETYAIEAPAGSKTISLNGAAAHKGELGDLLVIMSFAQFDVDVVADWKPRVLVLSERNSKIVRADNPVVCAADAAC